MYGISKITKYKGILIKFLCFPTFPFFSQSFPLFPTWTGNEHHVGIPHLRPYPSMKSMVESIESVEFHVGVKILSHFPTFFSNSSKSGLVVKNPCKNSSLESITYHRFYCKVKSVSKSVPLKKTYRESSL